MRIAILSDIHGNLEALEAVLDAASELAADQVCSLGDVVGYGPDPSACLALVAARTSVSLLGNHDAAVLGATPLEDFNALARRAVLWTRSALTPPELDRLSGLPYLGRCEGMLLAHATPAEPEAWRYIHGLVDAREHFGDFGERICFVGHSHRPGIYALLPSGRFEADREGGRLQPGARYIVNAGSVGQPRDRDPRAGFALLDTGSDEIAIHRVAYPVARTQEKMIAAGLPEFLADRLAVGL